MTLANKAITPQSVNEQAYAQLNVLGIQTYTPIEQFSVANAQWLPSLCDLLGITVQDCLFDSIQTRFDPKNNKLYLPKQTMLPEIAVKKAIWQQLQPSIN